MARSHRPTGQFGHAGFRGDAPRELYQEPHWFACRTRARAEKKVDRLLSSEGIRCYLPLIERERQWADRKKRVKFPLFPGYVFVHFQLGDLGRILRVPGLVKVVQVAGYPTPVREREIESVRALVEGANRTGVEPHPSDYLVRGQDVRVVEGPFEGMQGTLLEEKGDARVIVKLPAIRQAVGIELDRKVLRPVDND